MDTAEFQVWCAYESARRFVARAAGERVTLCHYTPPAANARAPRQPNRYFSSKASNDTRGRLNGVLSEGKNLLRIVNSPRGTKISILVNRL